MRYFLLLLPPRVLLITICNTFGYLHDEAINQKWCINLHCEREDVNYYGPHMFGMQNISLCVGTKPKGSEMILIRVLKGNDALWNRHP